MAPPRDSVTLFRVWVLGHSVRVESLELPSVLPREDEWRHLGAEMSEAKEKNRYVMAIHVRL